MHILKHEERERQRKNKNCQAVAAGDSMSENLSLLGIKQFPVKRKKKRTLTHSGETGMMYFFLFSH